MTPDRIAAALSELAELGLARRRHVLDGAQGARFTTLLGTLLADVRRLLL